jgi:hypothetical protein
MRITFIGWHSTDLALAQNTPPGWIPDAHTNVNDLAVTSFLSVRGIPTVYSPGGRHVGS